MGNTGVEFGVGILVVVSLHLEPGIFPKQKHASLHNNTDVLRCVLCCSLEDNCDFVVVVVDPVALPLSFNSLDFLSYRKHRIVFPDCEE